MLENLILANAAASRRAFTLVEATGHSTQLSDHGTMLFQLMSTYYGKDDDADGVNLVLLRESVRQRLTNNAADVACSIIDSFENQASPENFAEILL